jgi:hypothetical protein
MPVFATNRMVPFGPVASSPLGCAGPFMEISTFVRYRPSWRGILFVLVLVLVAAGIAGYLVKRQDPEYQGRASVFVSQIFPADIPDYLLRPVADNYQSALGLPSVTRAAANASGESQAAIAGGLTSERVSSTANVDVTYQSTRPDAIKDVLRVASRKALVELAKNDLARSERAATSAQEKYAQATAALAAYEATNGNDGSARHSELDADAARTLDALDSARNALDDAQRELAEATDAAVISVKEPDEQSRLPDAARAAVTAGLVAAMIGFIVLLFVDWRRRPAVKWQAPTGPDTAAGRAESR